MTCPAGRPMSHSTNRELSRGAPLGPSSVGGGAGRPRAAAHRPMAGAYGPHAVGSSSSRVGPSRPRPSGSRSPAWTRPRRVSPSSSESGGVSPCHPGSGAPPLPARATDSTRTASLSASGACGEPRSGASSPRTIPADPGRHWSHPMREASAGASPPFSGPVRPGRVPRPRSCPTSSASAGAAKTKTR